MEAFRLTVEGSQNLQAVDLHIRKIIGLGKFQLQNIGQCSSKSKARSDQTVEVELDPRTLGGTDIVAVQIKFDAAHHEGCNDCHHRSDEERHIAFGGEHCALAVAECGIGNACYKIAAGNQRIDADDRTNFLGILSLGSRIALEGVQIADKAYRQQYEYRNKYKVMFEHNLNIQDFVQEYNVVLPI